MLKLQIAENVFLKESPEDMFGQLVDEADQSIYYPRSFTGRADVRWDGVFEGTYSFKNNYASHHYFRAGGENGEFVHPLRDLVEKHGEQKAKTMFLSVQAEAYKNGLKQKYPIL